MYIHKETQEVVDLAGLRAAHPNTSFPVPITAEALEGFDYLLIEYAEVPEIPDGHELKDGDVTIIDGRAIRQWEVVPPPAPEWKSLIAARRYEAEIGGIEIAGMHVDTDDRSKLLINGAALEAMLDPAYTMQWKTPAGFVELDAAQVLGVARAVRAHVQACFNREAELLDALEAGTFAPEMLDQGWPA